MFILEIQRSSKLPFQERLKRAYTNLNEDYVAPIYVPKKKTLIVHSSANL